MRHDKTEGSDQTMIKGRYCRKCRADLRGNVIPKKDREAFGGRTHFDRTIGIYDMAQDRTVRYQCPDCGFRWGQ